MQSLKLIVNSFFSLFFLTVFSQNQSPYFTLDPTLTPDADFIIFSYEGDLWKVATTGGHALRLTAMQGDETHPSVSPDGKWLAFSSNQFGNNDVYIMPLNGGNIEQLTFHEGDDIVSSWSWDNNTVYFTSDRYNFITTYTIDRKGGTPKRLFGHFFNTVQNVVEDPAFHNIFFNESWESGRFAHRKRYKGDFNPDIKSYNPETGVFTRYTTYRGKDFGATIDKNGKIYFMSDRGNDQYNLYSLEKGSKKELTAFSTSIMWPKVSANGKKIVFRKDYQIFVYDVTTGKTEKPGIQIYSNDTSEKEKSYDVKGKITFFDVSPDGNKLAFVSRGKLFISDNEGKFVKEIETDKNEAVKEVKWLKDNKTLIYARSYKGYYNWYTISAEGNSGEKQLTKDVMNNRQLNFNSDRSKAVYLKGRNQVCLLDMDTFKSSTIATDELWGFYNSNPYFSPDDKYITYNAYRDFETDIFVYNVDTKQNINLTNTKVSESDPFWSPDGKYIYFSSDRTHPSYPYGTEEARIYQMALYKFEDPFKIDKVKELFKEKSDDKADDKKNNKEKDKKDESKEKEKPAVYIDPTDIMERLQVIGPRFGQQFNPVVIKEKDKTYILYTTNHSEGKSQLWKTTLEPFEKDKTEKVSDKTIGNYQLVTGDKKNYILIDGSINTLNLDSNKLEELKIDFSFAKSLAKEFKQMFFEAWAGFEENYYDEHFHGQDWQKLRDEYATYLPFVTSRDNLRLLFNEMLGELNTSHFGFYSNGDEEKVYYGTRSMATGIIFSNEQPYTVESIVKESPVDVKDITLRKGDKLVAVNGIKVDEHTDREKYFAAPSFNEEMTLTFDRNGSEFTVNVHPVSSGNLRNLLYDQWEDENQAYVDKKSDNRVAYIHMKNMGGGELTKFMEDLVSTKEANKQALILDLRYNTGGNVHDEVLRFLSQRTYLKWKYREGKLTGQSNFGYSDKPIVLLVNEQSLSDAEMTAAGFKQLGLGTIIGTETYRWIIFTSGKGLVDGSFYRLPSWGCYTMDGKDLEKEGVSPDIYIAKDFKDRLNNNHPQLDKAVEVLLNKLKEKQ